MKDITVIIPVVNMEDEEKQRLLKHAVDSVSNVQILIIGLEKDIKIVESLKLDKVIRVLVNNTSDASYSKQINIAVKDIKSEYFSILEFDDKYSDIWFKNVKTYLETDTEDTFAFLPLTEVIDIKEGPIGYANEAVWASSFSEEIGCYDLQCLDGYLNFNVHGGVIRTKDFINLGMLKESMKLTYWYEFLMRALYKGKRIFTIPKVGYYHFVGRQDSLSSVYANNMSETEADWWIDLAKKEYFFPHDRKKTFQEE